MATTLSRTEAERRRLRGIALLDQGCSQAHVARQLGVTPAAVSQWAKTRREGGDAALKARPRPGAPRKLNTRQQQRLEKLLLQGPRKHGYPTDLWTLSRIVALIEKHFGVRYDQSGAWRVLQRLGWSCQKPERRARERDEAAIATWRKKRWPHIKKRATKR